MKLKRPAPEELFLFEVKDGAAKRNIETPASPLSKKVNFIKCFIVIINLDFFNFSKCKCFIILSFYIFI